MKRPSNETVRWLAAELAMREIEAMATDTDNLKASAGDWFIDADEFDKRDIAARLRTELRQLVKAMHKRSERLITEGGMEAVK